MPAAAGATLHGEVLLRRCWLGCVLLARGLCANEVCSWVCGVQIGTCEGLPRLAWLQCSSLVEGWGALGCAGRGWVWCECVQSVAGRSGAVVGSSLGSVSTYVTTPRLGALCVSQHWPTTRTPIKLWVACLWRVTHPQHPAHLLSLACVFKFAVYCVAACPGLQPANWCCALLVVAAMSTEGVQCTIHAPSTPGLHHPQPCPTLLFIFISLRLLEGEHAFLHILLVLGRVWSGQVVQMCIAQVFCGRQC